MHGAHVRAPLRSPTSPAHSGESVFFLTVERRSVTSLPAHVVTLTYGSLSPFESAGSKFLPRIR